MQVGDLVKDPYGQIGTLLKILRYRRRWWGRVFWPTIRDGITDDEPLGLLEVVCK